MRIDCPSCAAAYEVPAAILTTRRRMRCVRCGAEFAPAPVSADAAGQPAPGPVAPAAAAAASRPAAVFAEPAEAVARPGDRMGLSVLGRPEVAAPGGAGLVAAAWVLSLALLGAGAWAAIAWRGPIMRAWPPSARLYVALGYTR